MGYNELREFVDEQGVLNILTMQICKPCNKEDCNGCEKRPIVDGLDDKICDDTLKFMKEAALKASDEYRLKTK
jgi:hypothetical protein